jgi:hypothetical protein
MKCQSNEESSSDHYSKILTINTCCPLLIKWPAGNLNKGVKMRLLNRISLILFTSIIALYGCDTPVNNINSETNEDPFISQMMSKSPWAGMKATGEFRALWQGCEEGHEEPVDHEEGGCKGHEDTGDDHGDDGHSDDGHSDDGHDDSTHGDNRPARDFFVQFDAQMKKEAKGSVTFSGINDYEGVGFTGSVTWVEMGRSSNELFFGGDILNGNVNRGCFLFSVQDNGEGNKAEADRLQYRLYGSSNAPCHMPDHFPKGYPIEVYDGNLSVL